MIHTSESKLKREADVSLKDCISVKDHLDKRKHMDLD